MDKRKKLTASQEDYLEAIYQISLEKKAARAKDIAEFLGVKASSVTTALRNLSALELVNYAPYDLITLTDKGTEAAEEIVNRHQALKNFLTNVLGVEKEAADEAACRMEHSVPNMIVERLIKYAEYVETCPKGGITWDSGFGFYCKEACLDGGCERANPQNNSTLQDN
ncbi:MAG: metal-dependent transcriptional regulator [Desulfocapsaceae bacterium]|nr:metal-dependent transcriptional regulator [Desulfocapsaceae bacterium]